MTRVQLQQAVFPAGPLIWFGGMNFAVPALAWLTGPLYSAFKARLWNDSLSAWSVKWECRDFARYYACLAQECNAVSQNTPAGDDAIAVGEFWFHPDGNPPGQDHCINACVAENGLVFIEPQTGLVRPTSPAEIASCTYVRF